MKGADQRQTVDQADARRDQILEAAAECFRQKGFHAASMAIISKTAGMSVGHIYHYFQNKEAIIAALIVRNSEQLHDVLNAFQAQGDFVNALLADLPDGLERTADREQSALKLEFIAESARNSELSCVLNAADASARQRLSDGLGVSLRARGQSDVDLDTKVMLISALFTGLAAKAAQGIDICTDSYARLVRRSIEAILFED
ncbi:TetR/AcrR family transcriptional regulator [uncultured Abyssibacter sp.]|uniref:TetR/AcrR family transcriptional regulator n=1 Tax=uncultured Abyssibacter sp. TaxID=2320202 RepID=UPI0032B1899A